MSYRAHNEAEAMDSMGACDEAYRLMEELTGWNEREEYLVPVLRALELAYANAKNTDAGFDTHCAQCDKLFRKRHPEQAFCSNARSRGKGKKNCKDVFWNRIKGLKHSIALAGE